MLGNSAGKSADVARQQRTVCSLLLGDEWVRCWGETALMMSGASLTSLHLTASTSQPPPPLHSLHLTASTIAGISNHHPNTNKHCNTMTTGHSHKTGQHPPPKHHHNTRTASLNQNTTPSKHITPFTPSQHTTHSQHHLYTVKTSARKM